MDLSTLAVEAEPKAASKKAPLIAVASDMSAKIERRCELKQMIKDAEAELEGLDKELFPPAESLRIQLSRSTGRPVGSVRMGIANYVTYHNSQACYPHTSALTIRSVFGETLFSKYFQPSYYVDLDVQKLNLSPEGEELLQHIKRVAPEGIKFNLKALPLLEIDRTMDERIERLAKDTGIKPVQYFRRA